MNERQCNWYVVGIGHGGLSYVDWHWGFILAYFASTIALLLWWHARKDRKADR